MLLLTGLSLFAPQVASAKEPDAIIIITLDRKTGKQTVVVIEHGRRIAKSVTYKHKSGNQGRTSYLDE